MTETTEAPAEKEAEHDEGAMTIWEHLDELRSRLVKALLAAVVGAGVGWYFRKTMFLFLAQPLKDAWVPAKYGPFEIHFRALGEGFVMYLKIAILGGFVMAFPLIAYQIWAFVAPGLYKKEKKYSILFVLSSCGLFVMGSYFSWRFAFPVAAEYLLSYGGIDPDLPGVIIKPTLMITEYIGFITKMLMAFGIIFELPVVVLFLSVAGLINHTHLIKFFRYFIVIAFVIAAILTPPDPLSQIMMAVPLMLLYGISIGVAWLFGRKDAAPND